MQKGCMVASNGERATTLGAYSGPQQIMNLYDSLQPYSSLFFFKVPNENTWTCTQWKGKQLTLPFLVIMSIVVDFVHFLLSTNPIEPSKVSLFCIFVVYFCFYSSMCQQQTLFCTQTPFPLTNYCPDWNPIASQI